MNNRHFEVAHSVNDIASAEVLKGLLEANEISVFIAREGYETAMGLTGLPTTNIEILVSNDQVEAAKKIIQDYYAGGFSNNELEE